MSKLFGTDLLKKNHTHCLQVPDAGVDTLIPLPLQGKDNTILQQLLPTLLNPAVLGQFVPGLCCALVAIEPMVGAVW